MHKKWVHSVPLKYRRGANKHDSVYHDNAIDEGSTSSLSSDRSKSLCTYFDTDADSPSRSRERF